MFYLLRRRYTRACILSQARSGSNLLFSLLNSHPDILIHSEIFNSMPSGSLKWQSRSNPVIQKGEDPIHYLHRHTFPLIPEGKRAIGFKLFPADIDEGTGFEKVWGFLHNENIRIIYLHRENHLDIALSHAMATRDKKWYTCHAGRPAQEPIILCEKTTIQWLHMLERWHEFIKLKFPKEQIFCITYNDLLTGHKELFSNMQRFLNIPEQSLWNSSGIVRQRMLPRKKAILNFDELRSHIALDCPRWLHFFDEPEVLHNANITAPPSLETSLRHEPVRIHGMPDPRITVSA